MLKTPWYVCRSPNLGGGDAHNGVLGRARRGPPSRTACPRKPRPVSFLFGTPAASAGAAGRRHCLGCCQEDVAEGANVKDNLIHFSSVTWPCRVAVVINPNQSLTMGIAER